MLGVVNGKSGPRYWKREDGNIEGRIDKSFEISFKYFFFFLHVVL